MRLRVVRLPAQEDGNPYLLAVDRAGHDMFEPEHVRHIQTVGEAVKEQSGGMCHGLLIFEGELEIE
jgi:hypothetical protein